LVIPSPPLLQIIAHSKEFVGLTQMTQKSTIDLLRQSYDHLFQLLTYGICHCGGSQACKT